jgi:hypothetical protein
MSSSVTALNPSLSNQNSFTLNPWESEKNALSANRGSRNGVLIPQESRNAARLSSEYYSVDRLAVTYTNKDGDSVSLNMEHIEYQKAQIDVQTDGPGNDQDWQKIVEQIKNEFVRMKQDMIAKFMESVTGKKNDENGIGATPVVDGNDSVSRAETTDEIKGLPEYWNAENTSQRIVDFATSFLSMFEGKGQDFLNMIKGAIEEGFSQAQDMLGNLPDPVSKLVNDTHDLVFKKLEDWAKASGINVDDDTGSTEQALAA